MDIQAIDKVVEDPKWLPRRGWHDDHRGHDRMPSYLPAMMQVRAEFFSFVDTLRVHGLLGATKCLQLGMGECDASHEAWRKLFQRLVITIDFRTCGHNETMMNGLDLRSPQALKMATDNGPYDLVFIDAGHKFADVKADHEQYGALVRPGGIVAFHDALKRKGYEEEVDVWRYLDTLTPPPNLIATEVGIAWYVKG